MRSHIYAFGYRDLMRLIGGPLVFAAGFAVLMHGGTALKLLPKPRPTLDVDRTIIVHQAEASASQSDAEVLLIGDSSCLIDVSARQLSEALGRPALNLGTLSFLDLNEYAVLLRRFAAANPNTLKAVVLLMHPEALRRAPGGTHHAPFFRAFLGGDDFFDPRTIRDRVSHALGLEKFRSRIVARILPTPLSGVYRGRFGFSENLETFMAENRGSSVELKSVKFEGNAEYRLGGQLESTSRAFRSAVPPGVKLIAAITPAPRGHVLRNYEETQRRMLERWAVWLGADLVLADLPPTMPDEMFAMATHLNAQGAREYTTLVAASLRRALLK
jgi:hypothetical protein